MLRSTLLLSAALFALLSVPRAGRAAVTFATPVRYDVNNAGVGDVTARDFDGDGKLDLANSNGEYISLLYGVGDGTFGDRRDIFNGAGASQVIGADVDDDSRLDLVFVTGTNEVWVRRNLGSRSFGDSARYPVGTKPYGVTAADFNEDGKLDLAVSNDDSHNMCVLLNTGNGTFGTATFYGGGNFPSRILDIDIDRDGHTDLAMANYVSGNVTLYRGDGTGAFTGAGSVGVGGSYPAQVIKDDFSGDGILDLATANTFSHNITVLFGHGDGSFTAGSPFPGNTYPHIMGSADFDGDGDPDIATPNNGTNYFSFLENVDRGAFAAPVAFPTPGGNVRTLAIGDFDRDRQPDVVAGDEGTGLWVFLNRTGGDPRLTYTRPTPGAAVRSLTAISGTATDDSFGQVTSISVRLRRRSDNRYWTGAAWVAAPTNLSVTGTESWSVTSPLPAGANLKDGGYLLLGTVTDDSGNTASANAAFILDRTAPVSLRVTRPSPGAWVNALTSITGTATDNTGGSGIARVTLRLRRERDGLYWRGSTWGSVAGLAVNGTTSWSRSAGLPGEGDLLGGTHTLFVYAADRAGNITSLTSTFRVDKAAPGTLAFTAPIDGSTISGLPAIQGTAADSASGIARVLVRLRRLNDPGTTSDDLYWTGTAWTSAVATLSTDNAASWSVTSGLPAGADLPPGAYWLYAYAYDRAGNVKTLRIAVTVQ
jgi:hypothetical protein